MHGLDVKHRHLPGNRPLSWVLAHDICARFLDGKMVVVTDKPFVMLSVVKKQWASMLRKVQTERAKTLNAVKIQELSKQFVAMQNLKFSAKLPEDMLEADVTFATAENLARIAPECWTMFISYDFPKEQLYLMTAWMPMRGVVVIYG